MGLSEHYQKSYSRTGKITSSEGSEIPKQQTGKKVAPKLRNQPVKAVPGSSSSQPPKSEASAPAMRPGEKAAKKSELAKSVVALIQHVHNGEALPLKTAQYFIDNPDQQRKAVAEAQISIQGSETLSDVDRLRIGDVFIQLTDTAHRVVAESENE